MKFLNRQPNLLCLFRLYENIWKKYKLSDSNGEDGSVSKMLTVEAWRPEFKLQNPLQPGPGSHVYTPVFLRQ